MNNKSAIYSSVVFLNQKNATDKWILAWIMFNLE